MLALTLAVAAAVAASACNKAEAPAEPLAASGAPSTIAPPRTPAQEVPLPPLPSSITAAPDPAPKALDSAENEPKAPLTKAEESNEMPKALHGNNHSSTALDREPSKQ
jgi:hypothetical protein